MLCAPAFPAADLARGGVQLAMRAQVERLAPRHRLTVVAPLRIYPPIGRYRRKMGEVPEEPVDETALDLPSVRILRPRHYHLPLLWPWTDPLGVELGLRSALDRAGRPDLLHGHWLHPHGWAAAAVGRRARIPVVLTAHGTDVARLDDPMASRPRQYQAAVRAACEGAAAVICVSQAMRERLASLLDPGFDRLQVIPNGVALEDFRPIAREAARATLRRAFPESSALAADRRLLAFAGDLLPVKQVDRLLHALTLLVPSVPEVALAIVGDGLEAPALAKLAVEHHLGSRVLFAGLRPHREIATWLAAADLFVLPSAAEGLPLVIPEALAAGTPVVASRVGGIPECIREGETGILVDPKGVAPLAEALRSALGRSWDRARIRASAEPFGWDAQVAKLEQIYRAVAGGG